MVGMERCLLVERVGENGSSNGVPDGQIWAKEQEEAKWGPERKKKGKGRNGAEESRDANKKGNARGIITCQSDFSSHEPLPRSPSDLLQPLECPFRPRKEWHVNRDEPHGNRNQVREPRKSERVKIESFVLCPTFLVPRNAKQRRGNCHNPIFTLRIFPRILYANRGDSINARTNWKCSNMLKSINPRPCFKDRRILISLTRFDQVWLEFDRSHGWAHRELINCFTIIWRITWRSSVW